MGCFLWLKGGRQPNTTALSLVDEHHPLPLFVRELAAQVDDRTWKASGGWNAANAVEVLARYAIATGDSRHMAIIDKVFERHQHASRQEFNDEAGWWALAWLQAYDLTGGHKYLTAAERLFEDMASSWDDFGRGGVWWTRQPTYKNAITNELFMLLSARLYGRTGKAVYKQWALNAYAWFMQSGLMNDDNLINDGLDSNTRENNGGPTWTHAQGVILGALVELARTTDPKRHLEYLGVAFSIANAVMDRMVQSQDWPVLQEAAASRGLDCDACQYKGVFVRYLSDLWAACGTDRQFVGIRRAFAEFVAFNAACIALTAGNRHRIGFEWDAARVAPGKPCDDCSASQTSGVDCLLADWVMNRVPDDVE